MFGDMFAVFVCRCVCVMWCVSGVEGAHVCQWTRKEQKERDVCGERELCHPLIYSSYHDWFVVVLVLLLFVTSFILSLAKDASSKSQQLAN